MRFEKITAILLSVLLVISALMLGAIVALRDLNEDGGEPSAAETVFQSLPPEATQTPRVTEMPVIETAAPPEETAAPEDSSDKSSPVVESLLAEMSLREKICQLFIVYPGEVPDLASYPVGGLVYSASDLYGGGASVLSRIAAMQDSSKITLLICADEEGGTVNRLMQQLGTTYIGSMFDYKDYGLETAYENAATIAKDMKKYGFNTDFAPVADVWSNPSNTVVGKRAYSDDFEEAADLVASAVEGFKSEGLICTVKHFPGHGDTAQDSHYSSAIVTKTIQELETQEFLPFLSGIDAGADMVMIGHLTIPSIDDLPATVSKKIVTDLLRDTLGYDGVIISDGLEMSAVTSLYSSGELCVEAVKAGIDILLGPESLTASVAALETAVANNEISIERIDESVSRILEMKLEHGLL